MGHVWRTDDNGGDEQALTDNGCLAYALDPFRTEPCGDWRPIGANLTGRQFGTDRAGDYVVAVERTRRRTTGRSGPRPGPAGCS